MRALRPDPPARQKARSVPPVPASPVFWSLTGSTASLATELATALERRGVVVHNRAHVVSLERSAPAVAVGPGQEFGGRRWVLGVAGRGPTEADAIILALPSPGVAGLLAALAPEASRLLGTIEYSSVAVVTLTYPADAVPSRLAGTGFLVPRSATVDGRPPLVTGVTYLSRKWPHLARAGDELIRESVGRMGDERASVMDDEELRSAVVAELGAILGTGGAPLNALVTRWEHAFPQYRVGHLALVAEVGRELTGLGRIAVAGAAMGGVGIPACIKSGRSAARQMLADLHHRRTGAGDKAGSPTGDMVHHPDLAK